jgi:hypothetical protein
MSSSKGTEEEWAKKKCMRRSKAQFQMNPCYNFSITYWTGPVVMQSLAFPFSGIPYYAFLCNDILLDT